MVVEPDPLNYHQTEIHMGSSKCRPGLLLLTQIIWALSGHGPNLNGSLTIKSNSQEEFLWKVICVWRVIFFFFNWGKKAFVHFCTCKV